MTSESPETTALAKLRAFIRNDLDPDERVVVASLLAPAIAQAFETEGDEVQGFSAVDWRPTLPETLAEQIRVSGMQVTLDADDA
ncbi:MAG: hypothetical protein HYX32_12750 [Actinobacteria bacterium]|nr:hypothetical protein [Actinomycetota bacterium]